MTKDKQDRSELLNVENEQQSLEAAFSHTTIQNMIYVLRGQQIMLDYDLAVLYKVETRVLNQAVKRNIARFPEKFCFQLSTEEYKNLKSQIVISSSEKIKDENYGGRRTLPYAFNEQGIAMLSAVLRSDTAIQVSIRIMETFVQMRRYMASNTQIYELINKVELKQLEYQKNTDIRFPFYRFALWHHLSFRRLQ